MRAMTVDPTDQTGEVDDPVYRVYFWDGPASSDEWELKDATLDDVLAWIEVNKAGRQYTLWLVVPGPGVTLARLRGKQSG